MLFKNLKNISGKFFGIFLISFVSKLFMKFKIAFLKLSIFSIKYCLCKYGKAQYIVCNIVYNSSPFGLLFNILINSSKTLSSANFFQNRA